MRGRRREDVVDAQAVVRAEDRHLDPGIGRIAGVERVDQLGRGACAAARVTALGQQRLGRQTGQRLAFGTEGDQRDLDAGALQHVDGGMRALLGHHRDHPDAHVERALEVGARHLTEPLDVAAACPGLASFSNRRVICNGQIATVSGTAWRTTAVTSNGTYDPARPEEIRAVPQVIDLGRRVREAQHARGLAASPRAFAVPLIVGALRRADAMGDALAARGLDD